MSRSSRRKARAAQRRQVVAFQFTGLGLVLIVLPHLFGTSILVTVFRPLAPLGWLLLATGVVVIALQRRRSSDNKVPPGPAVSPPRAGESRRPTRRVPLVERIDPVDIPAPRASVLDKAFASSGGRSRPTSWEPGVFAVIEWRRFEAVVQSLFAQAGFVTQAQSHGPDEGIDIWLYSKNQTDGKPVSIVQCKHWQGKRVGVDKVRELRGVMAAKGAARGQFATTSSFTPDAIAFAAGNGIKLHDAAGLLELIGKRTPEQQQALLDVALEGDYWRPTCVNCGVKLVERTRAVGGNPFWGCVNFPKCRTTMQMRPV